MAFFLGVEFFLKDIYVPFQCMVVGLAFFHSFGIHTACESCVLI